MEYTQGFVRQLTNRKGQPWQGVVKDSNGKQRTKILKTYRNRRGNAVPVKNEDDAIEALGQWRNELIAESIREADSIPQASTFVSDYTDSFIDDLELAGSVEASTILDYRKSAKRIREAFADIRLNELRSAHIQKWEGQLIKSGLSASTVGKAHRLLKQVLKHAVDVRDLEWNPASAVKPPKRKAPTPNSLSAEDGARLAMTLSSMQPTSMVVGATISLFSGLREGEACGLRWRAVDFANRQLYVVEAIGVGRGGTFVKTPKSESSRRSVPIEGAMWDMLIRRRQQMVVECRAAGMDTEAAEFETYFSGLFVLGYPDGRNYNPTRLSRDWASFASSIGLVGTQGRRITFHDLRHSYATRAIAKGADVKSVASNLGHANEFMTLHVYASADPEARRRASALVADDYIVTEHTTPYLLNK